MEAPTTPQGKPLDTIKMEVEIEKMHAEIGKIMAETIKTNRENWWMPAVYGAGFFAAAAGFAKLFFH
jgi:hypothetical protein